MDYYGSIVKSQGEINHELIERFKDMCYESYIKKLISNLRRDNIIKREYSISGWNVFHGEELCSIIFRIIYDESNKAEKRIKFLYCYNQLFDELNICRMICDKI